jgi:hypothetical protein
MQECENKEFFFTLLSSEGCLMLNNLVGIGTLSY